MRSLRKEILQKPHAICLPYPAQGHINPMLKLAKLLHQSNFHITFVHTVYNYNRHLKTHGPESLSGLPDFQFETIPDGLPTSDSEVTQDIPTLCKSTTETCLGPFKELLTKLHNKSLASPMEVPPVTCIISDGSMSFTVDAAEEAGIPNVLFWFTSACGLLCCANYRSLLDRGIFPLKDESDLTNGYLDQTIDGIPGLEHIRLRDFPSFLCTANADEYMVKYALQETTRSSRADALILNTFDALEHDFIDGLSKIYPKVLSIGPLHVHLNKTLESSSPLHSICSNLWREEPECITWLNSQKPKSVVYVNFGSITVMSPPQMVEFAWGLANTKYSFLWIIRPDLVAGEKALLTPDFSEETKARSCLASWCPQEEVLGHPSIGGFLTHCGWNSMLESVVEGVPMVCWPVCADQQTNCWAARTKWGIGMEIDNDVQRDKVQKMVTELMEGEKGKELNKAAQEWKKLAVEAVGPNGSTTLNFRSLVNDVLLSKYP